MGVADTAETTSEGTGESRPLGSPTVVLEDVHVTYRVYEDRKQALRQLIASRFRTRAYREIHALKGLSLTAREGEAVGVIGSNGSGKSTLMQTIAGLLPATEGAVYARSQPTLLGVGAALQPKVSGRRNIILGGLALGMPREEVEQRVDEIIEFAGLEDSIDLPLRTYSSGMKARLHFAIATSVVPDILLIDEALAVGDEQFKNRSEERIDELRGKAGTIFLVSHSLGQIKEICTRAIWLDKGRVAADGPPAKVVKQYKSSLKS